jgi:hypothetical protein
MTTAEILKQLESAKSEAEMLAMAGKLGVTRAFFNAGSVVNVAAKPVPKGRKSKSPLKQKTALIPFPAKLKRSKKKVGRSSVGA